MMKMIILLKALSYFPHFWIRKLFFKKKINFNLVIIDMDGTFSKFHSFKEGLKLVYHDGAEKYNKVILSEKKDNLSADNLRMITGLRLLIHGKANRKSEIKLIVKSAEQVNPLLLKLTKKLSNDVEVILATRSSDTVAKGLASEFNLGGGYGSVMKYDNNGTIVGAERLISDKIPAKSEFPFSTKEKVAQEHMEKKKKKFSLKNTIFISNDILDIEVMSKSAYSILVRTNHHDFIDNIPYYLGLFDFVLRDENDLENLIKALSPKVITK